MRRLLSVAALAAAGRSRALPRRFNPQPAAGAGGCSTTVCADDPTIACDPTREADCASGTCVGDPADLVAGGRRARDAHADHRRGRDGLGRGRRRRARSGARRERAPHAAPPVRARRRAPHLRRDLQARTATAVSARRDETRPRPDGEPVALRAGRRRLVQPARGGGDHGSAAQHRLHGARRAGRAGDRRRPDREPGDHRDALPRHRRPAAGRERRATPAIRSLRCSSSR